MKIVKTLSEIVMYAIVLAYTLAWIRQRYYS